MGFNEKMLITVGALAGGAIISAIIDIRQQKQIDELTNLLNKTVLVLKRVDNRYDELFKQERALTEDVHKIWMELE